MSRGEMTMLPSVVYFTFAYCSMLHALLPSLRRHRSVVRVRMVLLSLRLSSLPAGAANTCVTIADIATLRDRNDAVGIDDADAVSDFRRRGSQLPVQADRRRNRRQHRWRMCRMDWSVVALLSTAAQ
jgi:hypothetical protein